MFFEPTIPPCPRPPNPSPRDESTIEYHAILSIPARRDRKKALEAFINKEKTLPPSDTKSDLLVRAEKALRTIIRSEALAAKFHPVKMDGVCTVSSDADNESSEYEDAHSPG